MEGQKRCWSCLHCDPKDPKMGICRYSTPAIVMVAPGQAGGAWPPVGLMTDWCGKWEQGPMVRPANNIVQGHKPLA